MIRQRQLVVWCGALVVGISVGFAANLFWVGIRQVQRLFFGSDSPDLLSALTDVPWWQILMAPALGGLLVGVLLFLLGWNRPAGIADVMEARHIRMGRLPFRAAFGHAGLSMLSIGAGASSGREGPVVHLGASLASALAQVLKLPPRYTRMLLGCGAAAAVSASFNAPIAGVLFALEIILQNYALRSIAPVAIASVAGTVVTRAVFRGEGPVFDVPDHALVSYLEMPAFAALGLVAALIAMALIQSVRYAEIGASRMPLPIWLRPALGGLVVGAIAVAFPEILGVGYGTVTAILRGDYGIGLLLVLIVVKLSATAITLASRFGGGVFSPSLQLGALAGAAFGLALGEAAPGQVTSMVFYALVGMGAVAAAVLGAPISSTLILFELTGGYALTIGLLVSASIATGVTQAALGHSFFQWQLSMRGLDLTGGTFTSFLTTIRVRHLMEPVTGGVPMPDGSVPTVDPDASLEQVLTILEDYGLDLIAVVEPVENGEVIGIVTYKAALVVYKNALVRANIEDHQ